MFKEIYKTALKKFKSVHLRKEIARLNTNDLIKGNFESACAIYRGFLGEPQIDNDLFTAYKNIQNESLDRKIKDCNNTIRSFGFELFATKNYDGTTMKVMMIPNYHIRTYMYDKTLGLSPKESVMLYRSLGGNVI